MNTSLLTPNKDPMGAAIADFYTKGKAAKLRVLSSQFDEDEIPVEQLFRTFDEMPALEQEALRLASGKILDCGAGSGCHALALQDMGKEVEAIDISPRSVEVMQ
jgi:methylase of polypeptide subunit release factors